jgi:trans-aconitate 3-methyltransferase
MVTQARSSTPEKNISFRQSPAEDLHFLPDGSVDLVISTQAAHWFDFSVLWPLLSRKVRVGGTVALLGYAENIFVEYPEATRVMRRYCYDDNVPERDGIDGMGGSWEQPGRDRLRDLYREIVPPGEEWEDVKRWEYRPVLPGEGEGAKAGSGKEMENGVESANGERIMYTTMTLGELEGYIRTFSAYYRWLETHPGRTSKGEGGLGDVVDEVMQAMIEAEPTWRAKGDKWRDVSLETEWGSVVLLARRK